MPIGDDLITCDTNILFYAWDARAGERHKQAQAIVDALAVRESLITLQSLNEFYRAITRKSLLAAQDAKNAVDTMRSNFQIIPATEEDTVSAIDVHREHRISFWDALLWATARRAGCRVLLSEDMQDGRTLGGVTFRNPFKYKGQIKDLLNL